MRRKINNKLIRSFKSCYDPLEIGILDNESLTIKKWIVKYRNSVKDKEDIIWLICRNEFMTDRDIRLFAVWCAREALKLVENPDERSVNVCNVAEQFALGNTSQEELDTAGAAARDAVWTAAGYAAAGYAAATAAGAAARDAAGAAALVAAGAAARAAALAAARDAARDAQIDKLITYF